MNFIRQRPSPRTLDWVERVAGARVVNCRKLTGGTSSTVTRLTIDHGGVREALVLRQYGRGGKSDAEGSDGTEGAKRAAGAAFAECATVAASKAAALIRREAATLDAVRGAGLAAPEPLATDAEGRETDGRPTILMTRLPGRLDLAPADPTAWLRQIAATAASIHDAKIAAGPFWLRADAAEPEVPASATRPAVWKAAFDALRQPPPPGQPGDSFLHRDFQHFNLLWRRGRLTGVVDWTVACTGPSAVDLGHCRLNLAVLFQADWAERLRVAYEAETGSAVDPWWDLYAITAYSDDWPRFIPIQVAGRVPVDVAGMTSRVEDLLEATLERI